MNNVIINNVEVNFEIIDDEIFTNSLQIAEVFEKRHADVLRAIENLPNDNFRQRNFAPSSKVRKNGVFDKETKFYNLTRDGFSLLVMSYKIVNKKNDYLNPFITAQLTPLLPSHDFLKFSKAAFVSLFLFLNPPTIIQLSSSLSAHAFT